MVPRQTKFSQNGLMRLMDPITVIIIIEKNYHHLKFGFGIGFIFLKMFHFFINPGTRLCSPNVNGNQLDPKTPYHLHN